MFGTSISTAQEEPGEAVEEFIPRHHELTCAVCEENMMLGAWVMVGHVRSARCES